MKSLKLSKFCLVLRSCFIKNVICRCPIKTASVAECVQLCIINSLIIWFILILEPRLSFFILQTFYLLMVYTFYYIKIHLVWTVSIEWTIRLLLLKEITMSFGLFLSSMKVKVWARKAVASVKLHA